MLLLPVPSRCCFYPVVVWAWLAHTTLLFSDISHSPRYKALQYLLRIVILYNTLVYVIFGTSLYFAVWNSPSARAVVDASAARGDYAYFAAFHMVTAYNNCGFALQQDSFASLQVSTAWEPEN